MDRSLGAKPLRRRSPLSRALPLLLLAAMLAIGLVIEQRRFGVLLWETKVPAAALLAVAGWRLRRPSTGASHLSESTADPEGE